MSIMNMTDWKRNLLTQKKRSAMPIMTHPGIEMTGQNVIDAIKYGTIHFEAIRAIDANYDGIGATMIMDLTVEAEAFGSTIVFHEHEVPVVTGRLVSDLDSVKALGIPSITSGRVPAFIKAAQLSSENIHNKPIFGGCIGPFSLAGRLFDMTEIMTAIFTEPDTIQLLLEKCTDFLKAYIKEMKKTGINGLIIAEPAAGLLDGALCDRFSSLYVKQIVENFQDDQFLIILHNCGNTGQVTQSMISTLAGGLHFGNRMNMKAALDIVPSDVLVLGNIDPVGTFKMADSASLKLQVLDLLETTREYPNFILSSGCDTPPGVPVKNISAFYEALDDFNRVNHLLN